MYAGMCLCLFWKLVCCENSIYLSDYRSVCEWWLLLIMPTFTLTQFDAKYQVGNVMLLTWLCKISWVQVANIFMPFFYLVMCIHFYFFNKIEKHKITLWCDNPKVQYCCLLRDQLWGNAIHFTLPMPMFSSSW